VKGEGGKPAPGQAEAPAPLSAGNRGLRARVYSGMLFAVLATLLISDAPTRLLRQPDLSPTQVAFVYGGDIWTADRSGAAPRRLTRTPEAESYPRFSPDGRLIAFTRLGDVYVIPSEGGPERRITWHPLHDTAVGWSPDGRQIVINSERWKGAWDVSPHVFLVPVEGGWPVPLPVPRASSASFAPDSRRFAYSPFFQVPVEWPWRQYRGGSLAHIALFDPASGEYSELPRGEWNDVQPIWRGDAVYFLSDRDGAMNLYRYSLATRAVARLTSHEDWDVRNPGAAADAIVYENGGWLYVFDLAAQTSRRLSISLPADALPSPADQARWSRTAEQAWSTYQEKAFKRASVWSAIKPRYLELIRSAAHWSDADYVVKQMLGEAGQGHVFFTRAEREAAPAKTGLLGADFRVENGRYRVARILRSGREEEGPRSPLAAAGVQVREGDYILAINGRAAGSGVDIHALLVGLAGAEVRLSVASSPDGPAREVTVRPLGDERGLRYTDWVRANRERVAAASGGRAGYVHVPNVEADATEDFRRQCRALHGKVEALVIDERNNSGGTQTLDVIDVIERPPARMAFDFRGEIPPFIGPYLDVPKVMIANEHSISGGDELAFYFRQRKLGPLVGVRTMGGMIGNGGQHEIEGGWTLAIPEIGFFIPEIGEWSAENRGVEPDYRVEWKPADFAAGRDPQLEKAVELVLAAIPGYRKRIPAVFPYRPAR